MLRFLGSAAVGGAGVTFAYVGATDEDAREAVRAASHSTTGIVRFARTCTNAFITAVDYSISLYGKDREVNYDEYKTALNAANLRAAKRLYKVCNSNGGLYTKFGQGVSTMNHVLPKELVETLAPLHDKARSMSEEMAREAVESELGGLKIEDVFESFEPQPLAAASLAQVHKAVLKGSGEVVAVKVQYPYLKDQTRGDLATLRMLTDFVGYWFPNFAYSWLTPEFTDDMTLELDFIQEGRNGERLREMFSNRADVYVPKVFWKHSTRRMLIMEFIEGTKISNVDDFAQHGIHPLEVATTVSSIFGDMIHVHGFTHCDPHPGNLFVRRAPERSLWSNFSFLSSATLLVSGVALAITGAGPALAAPVIGTAAASYIAPTLTLVGGLSSVVSTFGPKKKTFGGQNGAPYQVVVLDHGMYRRLDPEFRKNYCMLWKALLLRDMNLGRTAAERLGVAKESFDVLSLIFTYRSLDSTSRTGEKISKEERGRLREKYKDVNAGDINKFLESLPRDLLFVMRSTNIVRSINLGLGGTSRLRFRIMGESAVRGLLVQEPTKQQYLKRIQEDPEVPVHGPYRINLPVASEIINTDRITWHQSFEMWRLGTYLQLIDATWFSASLLAQIVQKLP
mmetsp:Transcript_18169/g.35692  ORF Transcript_18169/g.35692 Transcript_18169/m.35692 type:complete len:624 (+) Transcript_18169:219-2090(+)